MSLNGLNLNIFPNNLNGLVNVYSNGGLVLPVQGGTNIDVTNDSITYTVSLDNDITLNSVDTSNLVWVNATGTNAVITNLRTTSFTGTNNWLTNITNTNFTGTNAFIQNATINNLTITSTTIPNLTTTNHTGTNEWLTNATITNLTGTNVRASNLTWTTATGTTSYLTNVVNTNFTGTNATIASLNTTNLTTTNFTGTNVRTTNLTFTQATGTNLDLTATLQVAGRTDLGLLYTSNDVDIQGSLRVHDNATDMTALINLGYTGSVANFRAGYIYSDANGDMTFLNQEPRSLNVRTDNGQTSLLLDGANNTAGLYANTSFGQLISQTGVFVDTNFQTPATGSNSKCAIISYGNHNAGNTIAGPNFTNTDLVQMLLGGLNNRGANGGWVGRTRATYKLGITSYSNDPAQDLNPIYPIYCVSEDAWVDTTLPDFYVKGTILSTPDNFSAEVFTRGNVSIGYPYASTGAVYNAQRLLNPNAPRFYINNTTTRPSVLIEDSSFPDTTPFAIDDTGRVIVGGTSTTVDCKLNLRTSANTTIPLIFDGTTYNGGNSTTGCGIAQGFSDVNAKQIVFMDMDRIAKNTTNAFCRIILFTGASSGECAIGSVSSNANVYMPMSYEGNPIKFFSNASVTTNPRMVYNANGLQLTDEAFRTNNPAFMTISENIDARPDANTLPVQLSVQSSLTGALGRLDIGAGKNVLGLTVGDQSKYMGYIQSNGNLNDVNGTYDLWVQPVRDVDSIIGIGCNSSTIDDSNASLLIRYDTLPQATGTIISVCQQGLTSNQGCLNYGDLDFTLNVIGAAINLGAWLSWRALPIVSQNSKQWDTIVGSTLYIPTNGYYRCACSWNFQATGTLGQVYLGLGEAVTNTVYNWVTFRPTTLGVNQTITYHSYRQLTKGSQIRFVYQSDQNLTVNDATLEDASHWSIYLEQ